jgi:uncharacterized repeat protein (TIGR01451 family)
MSNVERRRVVTTGTAPPGPNRALSRPGLRRRVAVVVGSACAIVGAGQMLAAPLAAGAVSSVAPLRLTLASYAGDTTTTQSASALAGSDVTYRLTVSNAGSGPQTDVVVPVGLPTAFTLGTTTISASAGSTTAAGSTLTWSIPTLAGGASATLTYTETTDAPAALESDATSASAASDQSTTPSSATAAVEVIPAADLTIAVIDGVSSIAPGASDGYTITLTNNGPSAATNATVTETFNGSFGALFDVSSIGGTTFTDLGGGQFQWTGVNLASGASATLSLTGTLPSALTAGSAFVSLATVALAPGQIDTDPVYNAADADVVTGATSAGPLDVALASYNGDSVTTTPSESAVAGTNVTYQVTVSNTSATTQTNVSIPVTLATNFTLDSTVTTSDGTTTTAAGVVTWSIPSLGAGASATLSYTETTDGPSAMESDTSSASAISDQSTTPAGTTAAIDVIPAADLTIGVTDGIDTIAPGASDTYTITLTNHGPSAATNATVVDTLNSGFTALFATSSVGGTTFSNVGTDQFEWSGIDLASGGTATFSLMGTVAPTLTSGSAFVDIASVALPPGQVDTDTSMNGVDSDTVIPVPQAISFTPPTLGVVGQSATLSATGGGSGNPVVFSVDAASGAGVCSATGTDGAVLDYTQAGTCVIDASQAGNASYAAAPTLTASIVVDQVPAFTVDSPPPTATAGQPYTYTFVASGVPAPVLALAAGAPSWLTIDPTTGALSGTPPTGTTSFAYSVVATNVAGSATAGPFAVTVATNSREADISAALACPPTVPVRTVASCTLTVANAGPATAHFVRAAIELPHRFWRVPAPGEGWWSDHEGGWSDHEGGWSDHEDLWFVGRLAPGSSASFTVSFRPPKRGDGTVRASAWSGNPDPDYANNVAVATVVVTG